MDPELSLNPFSFFFLHLSLPVLSPVRPNLLLKLELKPLRFSGVSFISRCRFLQAKEDVFAF